jgi:hypothetical protein
MERVRAPSLFAHASDCFVRQTLWSHQCSVAFPILAIESRIVHLVRRSSNQKHAIHFGTQPIKCHSEWVGRPKTSGAASVHSLASLPPSYGGCSPDPPETPQ